MSQSASKQLHMGRAWFGHEIEDNCPCPQAECGLAISENTDEDCPQHSLYAAKTIRQMHWSDECPGKES